MESRLLAALDRVLSPEVSTTAKPGHVWPRWIFLRALGLIYFSAFYSLLFQIKGLIGPNGILPAVDYLQAVAASLHAHRFWFAPTLFWFSSSNHALMIVCWAGLLASVLVVLNIWPRLSLAACLILFLSFVSVAQDFSGYQSDGMLLEAGFIALFFAPPGFRPGLGSRNPPSHATLFLLQWEWFRIYFESGVAKLASGDTLLAARHQVEGLQPNPHLDVTGLEDRPHANGELLAAGVAFPHADSRLAVRMLEARLRPLARQLAGFAHNPAMRTRHTVGPKPSLDIGKGGFFVVEMEGGKFGLHSGFSLAAIIHIVVVLSSVTLPKNR